MNFEQATAVHPSEARRGRYSAHVPDGWQQGRGAFGGLVFALLARAMHETEKSERPMRALTGEIPSPVMSGACEIDVDTLRRGSGLSCHSASVRQGDSIVARASAVFGKPRDVSDPAQEPATLPPYPGQEIPIDAPLPTFARNLRFTVTGALPFLGEKVPAVEGWVELRDSSSRLSPIELIALADSYWPALYTISPGPRPCATVSFFIHLNADRIADSASRRVFCRNKMVSYSQGFFVEERRVYSDEGQLLALNTQTFVTIR